MPVFTISPSGGNFTATSSWVGGVVPPSANTSDILGNTSSGPLYFNNLGARTIGSLLLTDYTSSIGFTGSATTLTVQGYTFSLGTSMSWLGNFGTGALNSQRMIITPLGATATELFFRGIEITKCRFELESSGTNTGKYRIWDKLRCKGSFYFTTHANGGPTVNAVVVGSATAGTPAQIELDPENVADNTSLWLGARPMANLGYEATFTITGTGSGKMYWSGENYYSNKNSVPQGSTLIIQSGNFYLATGHLAITKGVTLKYTGGTVSNSKRLLAHSFTATNNTGTSSFYIDTPNLTWGSVDLRHEVDGVQVYNFYIQNQFKTNNFMVSDNFGSINGNAFGLKTFNIFGTNSTIELGQFQLHPFLSLGGAFTNGFWYGRPIVFFQGGFTYSFERFNTMGSFFTEFGNEYQSSLYSSTDPRQGGRTIISGTAGTASFVLNRDENSCVGMDFRNINITGNTLYAFGSTWSSSTGISSVFPTGGTGGGGTASAEYSFAYIS